MSKFFMRYRLRTLLILLAVLPPLLAGGWGLYAWTVANFYQAALVFYVIVLPAAFLALTIYRLTVLNRCDD